MHAPLSNLLRRKLHKYALVGATSLRNRWAYPADLFGIVFSYWLFIFVFSRLWLAGFSGRAPVAGYGTTELTWYFIVAELSIFAMGNQNFSQLSNDIKTGQVAYTLARPWSFPLMALSEALAPAIGLALPFAAVGFAVGYLSTGSIPLVSWEQAACVTLSLLLTLILQFLCQFVLSLAAFWVEENTAFLWIHQKLALILGTFLPLEFFPAVWRPWLEATPYGWLAYPPSRLFSLWNPAEAPRLLVGQMLAIATMLTLSYLIFAAGRRRTVLQGG